MFKVFRLSILYALIPIVSVFAEHVRPVSAIESEGQTLDFNQAEQKSHDSALVPDNIPAIDPSEIVSKSLKIPAQERSILSIPNLPETNSVFTEHVRPVSAIESESQTLDFNQAEQKSHDSALVPDNIPVIDPSEIVSKSLKIPDREHSIKSKEVTSDNRLPIVATQDKSTDLLLLGESPQPFKEIAQSIRERDINNTPEVISYENSSESNRKTRTKGWYLGLSGAFQNRSQATETDPASQGNTFTLYNSGLNLNAALGYRFDNFRIDGEYSFFNNTVGTASANGAVQAGLAPAPAIGNVNLNAFMVNLYYDIPITDSKWKPYLGFGVGVYQSQINGLQATFFGPAGIPPVNTTSDLPFAYQARVGIGYAVEDNVEIYLGYRYFHGETLQFTAPGLGTFRPDGANMNSVELGVRALL